MLPSEVMMLESRDVNRYIRLVLLVGMILSVGVMILGLIMLAVSDASWEAVPLSLGEIFRGLMEGNPIAMIDLGILLLIATPLTRVVAALIAFALNRETKFVGVAILILVVVGVAVVLGG